MTDRDRQELHQRLVERMTELYRAVHRDVGDVRARNDMREQEPPRDEVDESQRIQQEDLSFSLAEVDARLAQAIEGALIRMRRGDYGQCVECGNEIEAERLRAVPWAARCIDCQESMETEARERLPTI